MNQKKKICCIYKIVNIRDKKFYLGSSTDFFNRVKRHKRDFKFNRHHNIYLQRIFNKYGSEIFQYEILKICNSKNRIKIEQSFLDKIDFTKAYNISNTASGGDFISNHPNREEIIKNAKKRLEDYKSSDEYLNRPKMYGEKNPNFGNK